MTTTSTVTPVVVCVFEYVWCIQSFQLFATPLLCPWDFPGKNTGVCCNFLLQWIFITQGSYPRLLCLLHWQADPLLLSLLGSPCCYTCHYTYLKKKKKKVQLCLWQYLFLWVAVLLFTENFFNYSCVEFLLSNFLVVISLRQ